MEKGVGLGAREIEDLTYLSPYSRVYQGEVCGERGDDKIVDPGAIKGPPERSPLYLRKILNRNFIAKKTCWTYLHFEITLGVL